MAGRIFISYRRADTRGFSLAIFNYLATQFGADEIFMDVDSIEPGRDFIKVLENAVDTCDVLIVLIGPNWLTIKDEQGIRRLDNPEDFVRVEIARALEMGVRVIPLLVDGALHLKSSDLPDDIKKLARLHAFGIGDYFHADMKRLLPTIRQYLESAKVRREQQAKEQEQSNQERQAEIISLLNQAQAALESKNWTEARQRAQAVLILAPKNTKAEVILANAEASAKLAREAAEEERLEEERIAKEKAEKERKEKEERAKQHEITNFLNLAHEALEAERWEEAIKYAKQVLALKPDYQVAQRVIADAESDAKLAHGVAEEESLQIAKRIARKKMEKERKADEEKTPAAKKFFAKSNLPLWTWIIAGMAFLGVAWTIFSSGRITNWLETSANQISTQQETNIPEEPTPSPVQQALATQKVSPALTSTPEPIVYVAFDASNNDAGMSLVTGAAEDVVFAIVDGKTAWRSGGGQVLPASDGNKIPDNNLAFDIDDDLMYKIPKGTEVHIKIHYLDQGFDSFNVEYDGYTGNEDEPWFPTEGKEKKNSGEIKTVEFVVYSAYFSNRLSGADFLIGDSNDGPETILKVEVFTYESLEGGN